MSSPTETGPGEGTLVRERASGYQTVAAATVGLSGLLFALGLAALIDVVAITGPVAGVDAATVLGALVLLEGVVVVGFGLASRTGYIETAPQASAGGVAAAAFTLVWAVIGALFVGQTLGLGILWVGGALVCGASAFALTAFPREDVGSTLPAGAVAILAGGAILTGVLGPEWSWVLTDYDATLFADIVVPATVMFAALLTGWSAAKTYGGYGARGRHVGALVLIYLVVLAILAVLLALVAFVVFKGAGPLFRGFSVGGPGLVAWPFVTNGAGLLVEVKGIFPAIVGTVWLVVGAVAFAIPTGVGAAVFLSEYARQGLFTRVVEVATNGLWSTPSIVFGLFGAAFLIPRFGNQKSIIAGQLTLGFMLLPLVLITSREAILAVPDEYRDASAALGVSKWQTIRSVVVPAAIPGITTGVILGVGRIAGETAPILLTTGGGVLPAKGQTPAVLQSFQFSLSPPFVSNPALLDASSALPYQLFALITAGLGGDLPEGVEWGVALTLLLVVLSFYAIGIGTRYYFRRKLHQ